MKKPLLKIFHLLTILAFLLIACGGVSQPGVAGGSEEQPTEQSTEPPSLQTIDLAGPLMEIGSTYLYVDGTLLVAVPGGKFIMGGGDIDNPIHEVGVNEFWIYSTKVTNAQYSGCVAAGKCTLPNPEHNPIFQDYRYINFPVTGVTHTQATEYCTYVNGRLPTEAEWEKTARGPDGNLYPWGDGAPVCDLLNFESCIGKTTSVTDYQKGISFYYALDMAGNVREWVADWYQVDYYNQSPTENPLGPEFGEKRSVRGSSYQDSQEAVLPSNRFSLDPTLTLPDLGFRCVVEEPTYFAPSCQTLTYIGSTVNGSQNDCTPNIQCNDVSITQNALCSGRYLPYTIVTFNLSDTPPDAWTFDAPGCNLVSGETSKFECKPGEVGPLTATGSCIDTNQCAPSCPTGYVQNGDTCVWGGEPVNSTACLPGLTFDPLTQCCSATPGTTNTVPLCPAGSYPSDGACVANPSAVLDTVNENVLFNTCEPPKDQPDEDPEVPACTITCNPGTLLDPIKCECYPDPNW